PAEELEVLERRQLAVDERLVPEGADRGAVGQGELAGRRRIEAGEHAEERRLPRPVWPGDQQELAEAEPELDVLEDALVTEALGKAGGGDHCRRNGSWARLQRRLRLDHIGEDEGEERDADDAVHGEERRVETAEIAGADQRMLVAQEARDGNDARPVPGINM